MDIAQFVSLVDRMREAQSLYFKSRDKRILQRSIILEKLVDDEIKTFKNEQRNHVVQPDLFNNMQ